MLIRGQAGIKHSAQGHINKEAVKVASDQEAPWVPTFGSSLGSISLGTYVSTQD